MFLSSAAWKVRSATKTKHVVRPGSTLWINIHTARYFEKSNQPAHCRERKERSA